MNPKVEFSDSEKLKYFDEICEKYYQKNFGLTSKTEIDLLMFKFFYQNKIKKKAEGFFNADSDYLLSKELGITQTRVRNLKIKKELLYPEENKDWKKDFLDLIAFAQYDEQTKKMILNISDPNLQIEIENHIEQRGLYIEKQLNSKLLIIRVEYFIELVISLDSTVSQDELIETITTQIDELKSLDKKMMQQGFGKVVIERGVNVINLLSALATISQTVGPILSKLI
ncbi:hypothetical protein [Vagococcus xieshaowenii]|uniref:Uncharacterized protein n=1 Tax=Vagococcus xieshaowenii TaxID=2562451 RepID=A0AAJ5JM30_9ENTE|nr:hypothetical protein [Vagococcus xieshaowenii]QCA28736.1 hypothetical protein E4Z98_05180 [Vagococcus xieshaowenii]TFZ40456.1 hypothetical protein E4031_06595 [Vagococcus xieshaowenii]